MPRNIVKAIETIVFDSATFDATYQLAGALPEACFYLKILNNSNRLVSVSYDGVNENDIMTPTTVNGAGSIIEVNFQTNSSPNAFIALMPKNTQIFLNGLAGGTGVIYIVAYYQPQN